MVGCSVHALSLLRHKTDVISLPPFTRVPFISNTFCIEEDDIPPPALSNEMLVLLHSLRRSVSCWLLSFSSFFFLLYYSMRLFFFFLLAVPPRFSITSPCFIACPTFLVLFFFMSVRILSHVRSHFWKGEGVTGSFHLQAVVSLEAMPICRFLGLVILGSGTPSLIVSERYLLPIVFKVARFSFLFSFRRLFFLIPITTSSRCRAVCCCNCWFVGHARPACSPVVRSAW